MYLSSRDARKTAAIAKVALLLVSPLTQGAFMPDADVDIATEAYAAASSNPLLLPGHGRGALLVEGSLKPTVTFAGSTGNSLELAGVLTGRQYSRRYGNFVLGSGRVAGKLRDSERLTVTAAASYQRDITADTLTAGVDALADPQSIRNTWRGEGSLEWRPNAETKIQPAVLFERAQYENSLLLNNTRNVSAEIAFSHRLTEESWIGLRPVASFARASGQPDLDRLAIFATLDRKLSPQWRLKAEAGVERIGAVRGGTATTFSDRDANVAFSGRLELCRTGERLDSCLTGSIGSEVSALEGLQRRVAVGLSATRRTGSRSLVGLQADYQRIEGSDRLVFARALDAERVQARYEWRLSAATTFSTELEYVRRRLAAGSAPSAAFVGVRLRWQPRSR